MTVRRPRPGEEPALRALQSTLPEPAPALLDAALEGGPAELLVATTAAAGPVGYALVVPGREPYLAELVVAPGHRRDGHGSALLAAVCERADGPVRTVARADDERALSFYRAHGFTVVERLPDRFEDDDGLLLRRP